jgi:hypothetical protein
MDINFLLLFLFAHLLGDFVLQTDKIAYMKACGLKGIAVHCVIVTAVQTLLMGLFGFRGILAGLAGGVIHFLIDYLKVLSGRLARRTQFIFFIFDQALHITVITILSIIFSSPRNGFNSYTIYIRYFIGIIVLAYVSTVAVKIILRDFIDRVRREAFFRKNERYIDSLTAVALWLILFLPTILACILALVLLPVYIKIQRKKLDYDIMVAAIKYLILMSSACLVFFLIAGNKTV